MDNNVIDLTIDTTMEIRNRTQEEIVTNQQATKKTNVRKRKYNKGLQDKIEKPMPKFAELNRMYEDDVNHESNIDENETLTPSALKKMAEILIEVIENMKPNDLFCSVLPEDLSPPSSPESTRLPVVAPKKRYKTDQLPYIVESEYRHQIPTTSFGNKFGRGDTDYGVKPFQTNVMMTNNDDECYEIEMTSSNKERICKTEKYVESQFNDIIDIIANQLKSENTLPDNGVNSDNNKCKTINCDSSVSLNDINPTFSIPDRSEKENYSPENDHQVKHFHTNENDESHEIELTPNNKEEICNIEKYTESLINDIIENQLKSENKLPDNSVNSDNNKYKTINCDTSVSLDNINPTLSANEADWPERQNQSPESDSSTTVDYDYDYNINGIDHNVTENDFSTNLNNLANKSADLTEINEIDSDDSSKTVDYNFNENYTEHRNTILNNSDIKIDMSVINNMNLKSTEKEESNVQLNDGDKEIYGFSAGENTSVTRKMPDIQDYNTISTDLEISSTSSPEGQKIENVNTSTVNKSYTNYNDTSNKCYNNKDISNNDPATSKENRCTSQEESNEESYLSKPDTSSFNKSALKHALTEFFKSNDLINITNNTFNRLDNLFDTLNSLIDRI